MNFVTQSTRTWHPIEEAIIRHIDRYGLTTPQAAYAAEIKGMTTVEIAMQRLMALVKSGELVCQPLTPHMRCFVLSSMALERLGRPVEPHGIQPLSAKTIAEQFAFLSFCHLREAQHMKLTHQELQSRFADLYRPGNARHYYVTTGTGQPRLGFLRIDTAGFGRWDRIIAKASRDLRSLLQFHTIRQLLEQQAFEMTIITSLPQKAHRIDEEMESRRRVFTVPVNCLAMPEMIDLIRPVPD